MRGGLHDLTGQTFGDFTPIEYLGKSKWRCRCVKCDNETIKSQTTLVTRKNYCPECKSLVGKTFGDYEVLSQAETENKYEYLGVYEDYNDAVKVRKEAEKSFFGDLNRREYNDIQ